MPACKQAPRLVIISRGIQLITSYLPSARAVLGNIGPRSQQYLPGEISGNLYLLSANFEQKPLKMCLLNLFVFWSTLIWELGLMVRTIKSPDS